MIRSWKTLQDRLFKHLMSSREMLRTLKKALTHKLNISPNKMIKPRISKRHLQNREQTSRK